MSVITFLSFRSTLFDRKLLSSHATIWLFPSKDSFFYDLLAVNFDKQFLTRIRISM